MIRTLCLFLHLVMWEIPFLYYKVAVTFAYILHIHYSLIHLLKYPCQLCRVPPFLIFLMVSH